MILFRPGYSKQQSSSFSSRKWLIPISVLVFLVVISLGCTRRSETRSSQHRAVVAEAVASRSAPVYSFEVVNTFPHDSYAFTQGLVIQDGVLVESTGLNGRSSLRRVDLASGNVLKKVDISEQYFAEGVTIFKGRVFQLTWKAGKGFIYDPATFERTGEFSYSGEGWGLTHDDRSLILSDGTNEIRFINPENFSVERTIKVTAGGKKLDELNELEYVKGEIFANIWQDDRIVRIDPNSGEVVGWIDLTGLLSPTDRTTQTNVLNGIAYDAAADRLFVTGKLWPKLFEVKLKLKQ